MRVLRLIATAVAMLLLAAPMWAQATIGGFTGGDPGEGLDMQGNFLYAVNMRGPGGFVVGDATFTDDTAPGVTVNATDEVLDWVNPEYGPTTNDNNLEVIMQSMRWSNGVPLTVTLQNLTVGSTYKLQLLFAEGCCPHGFDILVNGQKVADDFAPYTITGSDPNNSTTGAVVTYQFTANSPTVTITLDASTVTNPAYSDHNPFMQALTLEQVTAVPTMSTWSLVAVALGLIAVAWFVKR